MDYYWIIYGLSVTSRRHHGELMISKRESEIASHLKFKAFPRVNSNLWKETTG